MSTKQLAKRLGLVRQRSQTTPGSKNTLISNQIFSYIIVIDFESTCWKEKNNYGQEIIEFPAVLLNATTGDIDSEFHMFVQPQEHPILSEFCTELTGITQVQVEAGLPLHICLSRFNRWLQNLQQETGLVFPNKLSSPAPSPTQKICTFLTWSDWDLGVCLHYECKRKQLHKPDVLNSWIDLRSTYKLFYNRKPKGLNGALQDLGIQFTGREHSGLDDSRNTARLAARMMRDGCVMKITRSLHRSPPLLRTLNTRPADNKEEKHAMSKKEEKSSAFKPPSKIAHSPLKQTCLQETLPFGRAKLDSISSKQSPEMCLAIISPMTLLNVPTSSSLHTSSLHKSRHILCSTTITCLSNLPQSNLDSITGDLDSMEDRDIQVETEERCGSYDDVVLECDDSNTEAYRYCDTYMANASSCNEPEREQDLTSNGICTLLGNSVHNASDSMIFGRTKTAESLQNVSNYANESPHNFAVPNVVDWTKLNKSKNKSNLTLKGNVTNGVVTEPSIPQKTSSQSVLSARDRPIFTKCSNPVKEPFIVYSEPQSKVAESSKPCSSASLLIQDNVLSKFSTNSFLSRANQSCLSATKKGQKITSPLCACGRRAKRQVVSNGGPNHGRGFYCCPVRRSVGGGRKEKGCEFFKWESSLIKSNSEAASLFRTSVCQMNSTFPLCQLNKNQIRKSS